jgi:hypothetical protein
LALAVTALGFDAASANPAAASSNHHAAICAIAAAGRHRFVASCFTSAPLRRVTRPLAIGKLRATGSTPTFHNMLRAKRQRLGKT